MYFFARLKNALAYLCLPANFLFLDNVLFLIVLSYNNFMNLIITVILIHNPFLLCLFQAVCLRRARSWPRGVRPRLPVQGLRQALRAGTGKEEERVGARADGNLGHGRTLLLFLFWVIMKVPTLFFSEEYIQYRCIL